MRFPKVASSSRGMTLIELLIVVSIISTIFGLFLGGVQKVRSVAAYTERIEWREQHKLGETAPRTQPIRVLFIGNSFVYYTDLPSVIAGMAKAANKTPLIVESQVAGAHSLKMNWDRYGPKERIADPTVEWDFVVLQEMRGLPVARTGPDGFGFLFGRNEYFVPYAKKFDREIQERKAITMLFMTWKTPALTSVTQEEWTDSHIRLTKEIRGECSPVGMALEKAMQRRPGNYLFNDLYPGHLSEAGTYLAACTFYAALFNESLLGLPCRIERPDNSAITVQPSDATFYQTCAWDAYQDYRKRMKTP